MITFDFGWKTVIALGGAAATVILVSKIKPADAKEAFIHLVDASKEWAIAIQAIACSDNSGT